MKNRLDRMVDVAVQVLMEIGRPATAGEIISRARENPRYRNFINGKTPHKTLNARISVDIAKNNERSQFYRYGPASYGLRSFLAESAVDSRYRKVFIGVNRRKEVSNEPVAILSCDSVSFFARDGFYQEQHHPLSLLNFLDIKYMDRKFAEGRNDVKQLVSYAYIYHEDSVLAFEKGRYTSDDGEFIGRQSIGFGGHINYYDLSLFDDTPVGLTSNIRRELFEELFITRKDLFDAIANIRFEGYLVDSSTGNGKKHLGLAASVKLSRQVELETATLGIRNLRWISAANTPNSFENFEIWSQYLFRHLQLTNGYQI